MEHNRGKESGPEKQPELRVCLAKSIFVAPFGLDLELMSRWGGSLKRDTQYLSSLLLSLVIKCQGTTHIPKKMDIIIVGQRGKQLECFITESGSSKRGKFVLFFIFFYMKLTQHLN